MNNQVKEIKNQIHFQNEVIKLKNFVVPQVIEQFKPFVGTKILKVDNSFLQKTGLSKNIECNFKPVPLNPGDYARIHQLYIEVSTYSMFFHICICFSGGKYEDNTYYCQYEETSFYIGDIDGLTLKKITSFEPEDIIDLETELKNISAYVDYKNKMGAYKSKIRVKEFSYKHFKL